MSHYDEWYPRWREINRPREAYDAARAPLVEQVRRLEAERDEYQQAADTMAAAHKVERDQLARDKDELLEALEKIAFFQPDIGHPPIMSEKEALQRMARAALKKHEGRTA